MFEQPLDRVDQAVGPYGLIAIAAFLMLMLIRLGPAVIASGRIVPVKACPLMTDREVKFWAAPPRRRAASCRAAGRYGGDRYRHGPEQGVALRGPQPLRPEDDRLCIGRRRRQGSPTGRT